MIVNQWFELFNSQYCWQSHYLVDFTIRKTLNAQFIRIKMCVNFKYGKIAHQKTQKISEDHQFLCETIAIFMKLYILILLHFIAILKIYFKCTIICVMILSFKF